MSNDKTGATYHGGELPQRQPLDTFAQYGIPPETPHPHAEVRPGQAPWATGTYDARPNSQVAVWALVTGVVGVLTGWCLLGLPCIAAVVLGHVGVSQTRNDTVKGRNMAVAGLVLGYVSLIPALIVFFYAVAGVIGGGAASVAPSPWPSIT